MEGLAYPDFGDGERRRGMAWACRKCDVVRRAEAYVSSLKQHRTIFLCVTEHGNRPESNYAKRRPSSPIPRTALHDSCRSLVTPFESGLWVRRHVMPNRQAVIRAAKRRKKLLESAAPKLGGPG